MLIEDLVPGQLFIDHDGDWSIIIEIDLENEYVKVIYIQTEEESDKEALIERYLSHDYREESPDEAYYFSDVNDFLENNEWDFYEIVGAHSKNNFKTFKDMVGSR